MGGITITDVKIVELCSKHRSHNDTPPKDINGKIYPDSDLECIECSFEECEENFQRQNIEKIPVKDRTSEQHNELIKKYGGVREYLLSMGEFKDVPMADGMVEIPELNIAVEKERHSFGVTFENLKIPEGMRLMTLNEAVWLCNSKYAEELGLCNTGKWWGEYIEQPFEKNIGKYTALLAWGFGNFSIVVGGYLDDSSAARGVRFVKDIKKVKTH